MNVPRAEDVRWVEAEPSKKRDNKAIKIPKLEIETRRDDLTARVQIKDNKVDTRQDNNWVSDLKQEDKKVVEPIARGHPRRDEGRVNVSRWDNEKAVKPVVELTIEV